VSASTLVVTGYAMFFGGLLMLGARLGDRYGHRRVLLLGLAGFAAASMLAATSLSVTMLVVARCAQGVAAAASVPTALRLLTGGTRDERRRRGLAAWSAAGAAAGASGFLLGGLLTDVAGWEAVFWINVPLAALLLVATRATVPAPPPQPEGGLDVGGALLLTGGVMTLVVGSSLLEQADHRRVGLALVAGGVALLVALVPVERRAPRPLVPGAVVQERKLRLGLVVAFLNTATTSSVMTLATLHLQHTEGASATEAGLQFLPFSVCVIAGSSLAAPLLRRRGAPAAMTAGLALVAVGDALLLALPATDWILLLAVAVAGCGIGLSSVGANTSGTDVSASLQGTASGALNTAAQLGHALGVAGLVLLATLTEGAALPLAGTPLAWACAALIAAAAAVLVGRTAASSSVVWSGGRS
jgi:MFS family permease